MTDPDTFSLLSHSDHSNSLSKDVFSDYTTHMSSPASDFDTWFTSVLRSHHPTYTITVTPTPLLAYASLGYAKAELDTTDSSVLRWRFYLPAFRRGLPGALGDSEFFAKYNYTWMAEEFIVYAIGMGYTTLFYILKEPDKENGEDVLSHCAKTDMLLLVIGEYADTLHHEILVYDGYWQKSAALWQEVQKATCDDVILDDEMKKTLTTTVERFFDSRETYKQLDVPWKVSPPSTSPSPKYSPSILLTLSQAPPILISRAERSHIPRPRRQRQNHLPQSSHALPLRPAIPHPNPLRKIHALHLRHPV